MSSAATNAVHRAADEVESVDVGKAGDAMSITTLKVEMRGPGKDGSQRLRKMRATQGRIPGHIFGRDAGGEDVQLNVSLDTKSVLRLISERGRSVENTLCHILLPDGRSYQATPRNIQMCALTDRLLSLNLWIYRPGNPIRVPFSFFNEDLCVDLRRGSYLLRVSKDMEVICEDGVSIPSSIPVDLASKTKGEVIALHDVDMPIGVQPSKRCDRGLVIAKLSSNRGG
jgi:ribosomal protein L25 (general stress protein Ctc)